MSTEGWMNRIATASPRFKARAAGIFYLLNMVVCISAMIFNHGWLAAYRGATTLISTLCYLAVTLLFYEIFKPVSRSLSLIAALFSLVGCVLGARSLLHFPPPPISSLVFFGFYCLLIGYLIFRSTFMPHILGVLMALAGLGYLTYLSPPLAHSLFPWNVAPGGLGEGLLTLWLLVFGVNAERWQEQAGAAGRRRLA